MSGKSFPTKAAFMIASSNSQLLDQAHEFFRLKHHSLLMEQANVLPVRRFLKLNCKQVKAWRHPRIFGATEIVTLLNHRANAENVSAAKQNQALNIDKSAIVHQTAGRSRNPKRISTSRTKLMRFYASGCVSLVYFGQRTAAQEP
jgi:hypothetical protein